MSSTLHLRPSTPDDDAFLRLLFDATHLALLPEPVRTQLADLQYRGRRQTYATNFPNATDRILCLPDGTCIGRMLYSATPTGFHLVDLAVLPTHQHQGFATLAIAHLQHLIRTSPGEGSISLQVTPGNPAEHLYFNLGFCVTSASDSTHTMRWVASPQPDKPILLHHLYSNARRSGVAQTALTLLFAALAFGLSLASTATAQGILSVSPGRSIATTAGNGTVGYTGDGSAATSATLAAPSSVVYDASGNLYLADSLNHVVREISTTGTITTLAGTGTAGFSGDGGPAAAAQLDTPTGVALDASGNLYIADSHNHRIRKISGGIVTTVAGTGTAGFSGDGAAATTAQLALPSAVAVDASGNLYIADRNNHRIRKITGTTITTIAGDGEELFAGDGGPATAASLDSPSGVAVDTVGNLYIADRNNLRIRVVNTGGTISTLAGSGTGGFTGSFSGDGASATAAALAKPTGVSVDASGNVYIADTDNQRIRQITGSTIATIVGSGTQGYGSDTGTPGGTNLNEPKTVAPDTVGNLSIGDRLNQRIRAASLPIINFTSQGVGVTSAPQSITLANTGTAPITVSSAVFATNGTPPGTVSAASYNATFASTNSPCGALPITLAPGASCTENVTFAPTSNGASSGSVTFGGTGVVSQRILLAGTAVKTGTGVTLSSTNAAPFTAQPVSFSAAVTVPGSIAPTGSVVFLDGTTPIGTVPLVNGVASLTTVVLADGPHAITAGYGGDSNYNAANSPALPESILDYSFTVTSTGGTSVIPGQAETFTFSLSPLAGVNFQPPITFTVAGLPAGATATYSSPSIVLGTSPVTQSFTVQTQISALHRPGVFGETTVGFALLLLPFLRRRRRLVNLYAFLLLSLGAMATLSGCGGSSSGFLGIAPGTYNVTVTGTATASGGATLQRSVNVALTVQ